MQYLTLVDFLAKITYRKKNCLSVFDYYRISEPSSSNANRATQKNKTHLKGIVLKYDDASQFVFDEENKNYYYLYGFPPKD